jgi:hypothetical protein
MRWPVVTSLIHKSGQFLASTTNPSHGLQLTSRDFHRFFQQERHLLPMRRFSPRTRRKADLPRVTPTSRTQIHLVSLIIVLDILGVPLQRCLPLDRAVWAEERIEPGKERSDPGGRVGRGRLKDKVGHKV